MEGGGRNDWNENKKMYNIFEKKNLQNWTQINMATFASVCFNEEVFTVKSASSSTDLWPVPPFFFMFMVIVARCRLEESGFT